MNETLIFFILAMIVTLSHIWQKSIYLLGLVSLLWLGFLIGFMFPHKDTPIMSLQDKLVMGGEIICAFSFLLAFLVIKYVVNTPIWEPVTYSQFKKTAKNNELPKSVIYFVNSLLGLFFTGLIMTVVFQLFFE